MSDLMWHKGRTMRVVHQDELTREEKDLLRTKDDVVQHGKLFLQEIAEEPEVEPTTAPEDALDEQEDGDEPTMDDLRELTVAKLQDLADKEEVDLTGLKLKDDILGRMAAHFGLDPAS